MSGKAAAIMISTAIALGTIVAHAEDVVLPCYAGATDGASASEPTGGSSLCIRGGTTAVELEVRQTAIETVLSALFGAYKISYRSTMPLNELRDGTYRGPLGYVISRVLDGYNYVIKQENGNFKIIIFNKRGKQAVPAPAITEANAGREPAPVSRIR